MLALYWKTSCLCRPHPWDGKWDWVPPLALSLFSIFVLVSIFEREYQGGEGVVETKWIDCGWNGLEFMFELTQPSSYIITTLAYNMAHMFLPILPLQTSMDHWGEFSDQSSYTSLFLIPNTGTNLPLVTPQGLRTWYATILSGNPVCKNVMENFLGKHLVSPSHEFLFLSPFTWYLFTLNYINMVSLSSWVAITNAWDQVS